MVKNLLQITVAQNNQGFKKGIMFLPIGNSRIFGKIALLPAIAFFVAITPSLGAAGGFPKGVAPESNGNSAYVANFGDDTISMGDDPWPIPVPHGALSVPWQELTNRIMGGRCNVESD